MTVRGTLIDAESEDESSIHNESLGAGASAIDVPHALTNNNVPLVAIKEGGLTTEVTEPSASEEQLQGAVQEQE